MRHAVVDDVIRCHHNDRIRLLHVDDHGLEGRRAVIGRVCRRELHAQSLTVPRVKNCAAHRSIHITTRQTARHPCRRGIQLGSAQRRAVDDVRGIAPRHHRSRLADGISHGAIGIIIVARHICEGPGVVGIITGQGMRRSAHIHPGQRLVRHSRGRISRRVWQTIVSHAVCRHHDRRVRLANRIRHRTVGIIVVARHIREGPGVNGIAARRRVRRPAQIHVAAQILVQRPRRHHRRRVRRAIVCHTVGRHRNRRVRLVDRQRPGHIRDQVVRQPVSPNRVRDADAVGRSRHRRVAHRPGTVQRDAAHAVRAHQPARREFRPRKRHRLPIHLVRVVRRDRQQRVGHRQPSRLVADRIVLAAVATGDNRIAPHRAVRVRRTAHHQRPAQRTVRLPVHKTRIAHREHRVRQPIPATRIPSHHRQTGGSDVGRRGRTRGGQSIVTRVCTRQTQSGCRHGMTAHGHSVEGRGSARQTDIV